MTHCAWKWIEPVGHHHRLSLLKNHLYNLLDKFWLFLMYLSVAFFSRSPSRSCKNLVTTYKVDFLQYWCDTSNILNLRVLSPNMLLVFCLIVIQGHNSSISRSFFTKFLFNVTYCILGRVVVRCNVLSLESIWEKIWKKLWCNFFRIARPVFPFFHFFGVQLT